MNTYGTVCKLYSREILLSRKNLCTVPHLNISKAAAFVRIYRSCLSEFWSGKLSCLYFTRCRQSLHEPCHVGDEGMRLGEVICLQTHCVDLRLGVRAPDSQVITIEYKVT